MSEVILRRAGRFEVVVVLGFEAGDVGGFEGGAVIGAAWSLSLS